MREDVGQAAVRLRSLGEDDVAPSSRRCRPRCTRSARSYQPPTLEAGNLARDGVDVRAGVDEGAEQHVAADAGEAVEIGDARHVGDRVSRGRRVERQGAAR